MLHTVSNSPTFFSLEGLRVRSTSLMGTFQEMGTLEKIALLVSTVLGAVVGYTIAAMVISAAIVTLPTAAIFAFGIVAGAALFGIVATVALYSLRSRRAENVPPAAVPLSDFARAARNPTNFRAVATILGAIRQLQAGSGRSEEEIANAHLRVVILRPDIAAIITQSDSVFSQGLREALSSNTPAAAVLQDFPDVDRRFTRFAAGVLVQGCIPVSGYAMHLAALRFALDAGKSFQEIFASLRGHPQGFHALRHLVHEEEFAQASPPPAFEITVRDWIPRNSESMINLATDVNANRNVPAFDAIRDRLAREVAACPIPEAEVRQLPWLQRTIEAVQSIINNETGPYAPNLRAAFREDPKAALAIITWIPVIFPAPRRV